MSLLKQQDPPEFSFDHKNFYEGDRPFFLKISEKTDKKANCFFLPLDASFQSTFSWQKQKKEALFAISKNQYLLWHLQFSWEKTASLQEKGLFLPSAILAIKNFSETLWPLFSQSTLGVSLFRGAPLEATEEWIEDMHEMASYLPPNFPPFLFFDFCGKRSYLEQIHFLDKFREERFILGLKNALFFYPSISWEKGRGNLGILGGKREEEESLLGILLPEPLPLESFWEEFFVFLERTKSRYRLLYQSCATQKWDGLYEICTFSYCVNEKMERILQGFQAAGGKVRLLEKNFGAEGFEPPTYWSQTSRASQAALCPER